MVLNDQTRECACPRPVGTRGGCGAGWGPGACPGGSSIRWGSVRQDGRTPTRTSTRPPHPPHPAPCPYRTRDAHFPIRLSNLIRTLPILVVKTHHRALALACSSTNLYCLSLRRTWIHHWLFTVRHLHLILYAGKAMGGVP